MEVDWQTVFYIVTSLAMLAVFIFITAVILIIRRVTRAIDLGIRNVSSVGTLAKISLLKTLLKFMR